METEIKKAIERKDIWIIKITITPDSIRGNCYILFLTGDTDKPLLENGKVCVFTEQSILIKLTQMGVLTLPFNLKDEIDLNIELDKLITLVKFKSMDQDSIIINSINIMLDISNALKIKLPKEYRSDLYSFADHLTFNKNYGGFLKENAITRTGLLKAIYYLNGVILCNVFFK